MGRTRSPPGDSVRLTGHLPVDSDALLATLIYMATAETTTVFPAEIRAELEEAVRRAMSGVRDKEAMRRACERMDRISEEIRQKHGVLDIGVPAIRELRGELPES